MHNRNIVYPLFKLIRLGLNTEQNYSFPQLTNKEWNNLIDLSKKLSITGIVFSGIEKLDKIKRPEKFILLELIDFCVKTEKMNRIHNLKVTRIYNLFEENGFQPIIMKGQGIATLYSSPNRRMSGDVDIWVDCRMSSVADFVLKRDPQAIVSKRHIQSKKDKDMTVEVHTIPALMFNPFSNRKLERWFIEWRKDAIMVNLPDAGYIATPCDEMNRIFLLVHKYMHFLCGGIGMKQMTDYMMLLQKGFTEEERLRTVEKIKKLNMGKFCSAVMFILKDKFGLEDKYLLMKPNRKAGEILLEEIMTTGNFGFYDERYKEEMSFLKRMRYRLKRRYMMVKYFGTEPLWDYFNRVFGDGEID